MIGQIFGVGVAMIENADVLQWAEVLVQESLRRCKAKSKFVLVFATWRRCDGRRLERTHVPLNQHLHTGGSDSSSLPLQILAVQMKSG